MNRRDDVHAEQDRAAGVDDARMELAMAGDGGIAAAGYRFVSLEEGG